jgi:hypothetical protein
LQEELKLAGVLQNLLKLSDPLLAAAAVSAIPLLRPSSAG